MNIPGSLTISCAICASKLQINYIITIGNRYYDRCVSKVSSDQDYTGWIFCTGCRNFDCCAKCSGDYDDVECNNCIHTRFEDVGLYRRVAIALVSRKTQSQHDVDIESESSEPDDQSVGFHDIEF